MQLVDQFKGFPDIAVRAEGQQRAAGLVDIGVALPGAQGIDGAAVTGKRKGQFAQIGQTGCQQGWQAGSGQRGAAGGGGGDIGFVLAAIGNEGEGRRRHVAAGHCGQQQAGDSKTGHRSVPALAAVAMQWTCQLAPTAHPLEQQENPGDRQHQHQQGGDADRGAAWRVEE